MNPQFSRLQGPGKKTDVCFQNLCLVSYTPEKAAFFSDTESIL